MTREEYDKAHAACPNCKSVDIRQTLIGWDLGDKVMHMRDPNSAVCLSCNWCGKVENLVANASVAQ